MDKNIRVGDIVKWTLKPWKVYTVLEIKGINEGYLKTTYRVTHPDMVFPETGMWIDSSEIIELVQKIKEDF